VQNNTAIDWRISRSLWLLISLVYQLCGYFFTFFLGRFGKTWPTLASTSFYVFLSARQKPKTENQQQRKMHIQGYKPVTTTKSKLAQELVFLLSCILYSHSRFAFFFIFFLDFVSRSLLTVLAKKKTICPDQNAYHPGSVPRTTINNAGNMPTQKAPEGNYLFSWELWGLVEFKSLLCG